MFTFFLFVEFDSPGIGPHQSSIGPHWSSSDGGGVRQYTHAHTHMQTRAYTHTHAYPCLYRSRQEQQAGRQNAHPTQIRQTKDIQINRQACSKTWGQTHLCRKSHGGIHKLGSPPRPRAMRGCLYSFFIPITYQTYTYTYLAVFSMKFQAVNACDLL